jgi:hypothetical protein
VARCGSANTRKEHRELASCGHPNQALGEIDDLRLAVLDQRLAASQHGGHQDIVRRSHRDFGQLVRRSQPRHPYARSCARSPCSADRSCRGLGSALPSSQRSEQMLEPPANAGRGFSWTTQPLHPGQYKPHREPSFRSRGGYF